MSNKIEEVYGKNLFHDEVLKERLPAETYEALQRTIQDGAELEPQTADVIADAMMKWAVERGATHYTHWFQPLTGITAEKHESFIEPDEKGGVARASVSSKANRMRRLFPRGACAPHLRRAATPRGTVPLPPS